MIDRFRNASPGRQMAISAGLALLLAGLIAAAYLLWFRTGYAVLFSDLRESEAAAIVAELDKAGVPYRLDHGGKTILVADDETHILNVVSLKLRNAGYRVLTASDGQEALDLARQEVPDLLITDYHMPLLSGLELCRRLRQDPQTTAIPAIMLTARGYHLEEQDTRTSGIRCMLSKPFSPRHLLLTVNEVMTGKAA